jgi:iron-sulfur cluster assembly protein
MLMAIQVTDQAVAAIKSAAAKRPSPPKGLRVGIRGGGCTGFSYLFEWSDVEARPEDRVLSFADGQINVFIDPKSFTLLDGSTLDYASTLMASGFKWTNPNVKSTCGCGESVQF